MIISLDNTFAIKSLNNNATYHCYLNQSTSFHCLSINVPFLTSSSSDIQSCSDFTLLVIQVETQVIILKIWKFIVF